MTKIDRDVWDFMSQRGLLGGGDVERHLKEEKEWTPERDFQHWGNSKSKRPWDGFMLGMFQKMQRPGGWRGVREGKVPGDDVGEVSRDQIM